MPIYVQALLQAFQQLVHNWNQFRQSDFYVALQTPYGLIEIAAEVTLDEPRNVLVLWDMAIYPGKGAVIPQGAIKAAFLEAITDLRSIADAYNLDDIELIGVRVPNSSSARPGHAVHISVNRRRV